MEVRLRKTVSFLTHVYLLFQLFIKQIQKGKDMKALEETHWHNKSTLTKTKSNINSVVCRYAVFISYVALLHQLQFRLTLLFL